MYVQGWAQTYVTKLRERSTFTKAVAECRAANGVIKRLGALWTVKVRSQFVDVQARCSYFLAPDQLFWRQFMADRAVDV